MCGRACGATRLVYDAADATVTVPADVIHEFAGDVVSDFGQTEKAVHVNSTRRHVDVSARGVC